MFEDFELTFLTKCFGNLNEMNGWRFKIDFVLMCFDDFWAVYNDCKRIDLELS
jgi:hypothetical protein